MNKLNDTDVIILAKNLVAIIQDNNDNNYTRINKVYLNELVNLLETKTV